MTYPSNECDEIMREHFNDLQNEREVVTLPPRRYLKSRAMGDATYSEHSEGWDDCLHEVCDALTKAGVPFVIPPDAELPDDDPACMCGSLLSQHTVSDNHGFVGMEEYYKDITDEIRMDGVDMMPVEVVE
jgi:hypothetical protein